MAVCLRRGIPLEDMEFVQFHPTGLRRLGILVSEAARGEGGILRNLEDLENIGSGKDGFMAAVAPTVKDLAPRDMVSRAIYNEIKAGRGIDGGLRIAALIVRTARTKSEMGGVES